jgi:hypothetical protein
MSPNEQNVALAKACGWTQINPNTVQYTAQNSNGKWDTIPDYVNDLNAIHDAKETLGINDRNNLDIRVKWVGALRDVVSRRCPLNKLGTPVVSDLDILCASAEEHAEALLKTLKKWKTKA